MTVLYNLWFLMDQMLMILLQWGSGWEREREREKERERERERAFRVDNVFFFCV